MNEQQVYNALASILPPEKIQGDEVAMGNDLLERLLIAFRTFLKEYVELPPKEVVLKGFENLLDTLLLSSTLPTLAKGFIRAAAMIAAEQIYLMLEKVIGN